MSLKVERLENELLKSNTYLIKHENSNSCYVVDPGDYNQIKSCAVGLKVSGVFLTHSHIDHIYGLDDLYNDYVRDAPRLYLSDLCLIGLQNPKVNGSYYMSQPYMHVPRNYEIVAEGTVISLFQDECQLKVIETPGHTEDSLTFILDKYLFTGDSYIPGEKVHTRSKSSNKLDAKSSLDKIKAMENVIICPGHGVILNRI